jgi:hypothetical protein
LDFNTKFKIIHPSEITGSATTKEVRRYRLTSSTVMNSLLNVLMLFYFALEYAIRRVQVIQDGLKLNDTYQLLVYADDVNILGGSVHAHKKNAEALVVDSKESGLDVNADKTKYMVMSLDQNAG